MNLTFRNVSARLGEMVLEMDGTLDTQVTALFGPSGSGKTTLLEIVAGLRRPDLGMIEFDGVVLTDVSSGIYVPSRERAIGYVPQDLALFPHLTVRQNLAYGMKPQITDNPFREKLSKVLEIGQLLDRIPGSLSGGEKQRVAFARALLASPKLLLLDEPLASLDEALRERILPYLLRLRDEFGIPMIYVTHSTIEVMTLCNEMLVLENGKCTTRGKPDDLFVSEQSKTYRLR